MIEQKYSSKCTDVNGTSGKLPVLFKKVEWKVGEKNLDYGGGKTDISTIYLATKGVTSFVYDLFNRSETENKMALSQGPFDTITLSNVLNVILESEVREDILNHCKNLLKPLGRLYITVYNGNGTNIPTINEKRNSCQLNRKLVQYIAEVGKVFGTIEMRNNMIIAEV